MTANAQPDFSSESRLVQITAAQIVEMRSAANDFVDPSGALGLGAGDLLDLKLPAFQRGLKWDKQKLSDFHESLIQGWPMGVMVIAVERSSLLNVQNGQRKYVLSLIDGQQRSWALSQLLNNFWRNPWFTFASPKWNTAQPAAGPVVDAGVARDDLAHALGLQPGEVEKLIGEVSKEAGQAPFLDYADLLDELARRLDMEPASLSRETRGPARRLCGALLAQQEGMRSIPVPVLLLTEALQPQLPSIFRRLNSGVPLKGYDLLAAEWESARLQASSSMDDSRRSFLTKVLEVAEKRIKDSYSELGDGYEIDPNQDPLQISDLSLFDLLYFLGHDMAGHKAFDANADVLAFQTSALIFRGAINRVDGDLRAAFPIESAGQADLTTLPTLFQAAAKDVAAALKPLMDVSANLSLKGKVGLTPAVVYASAVLTLQHRVEAGSGTHLKLRKRGASAEDRITAWGDYLNATERLAALKRSLPAWYLHDALTSVFAGSRAYQAAMDRVWIDFRSGRPLTYQLKTSDQMLRQPALPDLQKAFLQLWDSENRADRTPQRRRVSDAGSVLMRAAYSHVNVHDVHIDHVMPFSKGRAAATQTGEIYPLNHIANLVPIDPNINNGRQDADWHVYVTTLGQAEVDRVTSLLLVPIEDTKSIRLATAASFSAFLSQRFKALVARAMENFGHPGWLAATPEEREAFLAGTVGDAS